MARVGTILVSWADHRTYTALKARAEVVRIMPYDVVKLASVEMHPRKIILAYGPYNWLLQCKGEAGLEIHSSPGPACATAKIRDHKP